MVTNGLPCSSDTGSPVEPVSEGGTTSPGGSVSVVSVSAASSSSAPCPVGPFIPGLGPVASSSFYPVHPGSSFDLKENIDAWRSIPAYAASMYGSYPPGILAGYPMLRNGYAMDLNGSRRKNATRETTSTLKAWLNEHRKNPYPTKGEKVMLAIITQMTLTQVSTWFANARRRLKKENKMTWSPRNRCDDEEEEEDDCKEGNYNSFNENRHKEVEPECNIEDYDSSSDNLIEKKRFKRDDSDSGSTILSSYPPHGHPDLHNHHLHPSQPHPLLHPLSQQFSSFNQPLVHQLSSQLNCKILTSTTSYPHPSESSSSSPTVTIDHNQINNHQPPPATKPRIWSIVELATSSSASDTSETCVKHETK